MDSPLYSIKQLALTLRDARIARGISQRELAERAGVGQSRLARIEAGDVDVRTSTLVQLARALDFELVLAPRRVLPAVQSLTNVPSRRPRGAERRSVRGTPIRVLRQIQQSVAVLERDHPSSNELSEVKSALQAVIELGQDLEISSLEPLRRSVRWLALARANNSQAQPLLVKTAAQLKQLRQMLPAPAHLQQAPEVQRAAYSLEDEIS